MHFLSHFECEDVLSLGLSASFYINAFWVLSCLFFQSSLVALISNYGRVVNFATCVFCSCVLLLAFSVFVRSFRRICSMDTISVFPWFEFLNSISFYGQILNIHADYDYHAVLFATKSVVFSTNISNHFKTYYNCCNKWTFSQIYSYFLSDSKVFFR